MMAQAGRDPLFYAALDVANADAAEWRGILPALPPPRGWLEGRSSADDGSDMTAEDQEGVQCSLCHGWLIPFLR